MQADTEDLAREVHRLLLTELDADAQIDRRVVTETLARISPLLDANSSECVVASVLANVHGLGCLEDYLSDDSVSDVMVVGGRGVWIERDGVVVDTGRTVEPAEIVRLIERIVAPLGLRVDRASPIVDARLPDGSRVNAVVPPLAVDGPCISIRKFGARHIALSETASPQVAGLLADAVRSRMNILVTGGTGSGKTTLLNALARYLGANERIVTVEDAAELRLPIRHVVRLESRPANAEGVGEVSLRALVRNALRMRPDRILVGEVRGSEALDMLQAMNTGHEGSMSTCHANSPHDALRRVETMVLMGVNSLPLAAVRQQVFSSIDLVVQIARDAHGRRRVVCVGEVCNEENPSIRELAIGDRIIADPERPARRAFS